MKKLAPYHSNYTVMPGGTAYVGVPFLGHESTIKKYILLVKSATERVMYDVLISSNVLHVSAVGDENVHFCGRKQHQCHKQ